jgi:hypothetical protein
VLENAEREFNRVHNFGRVRDRSVYFSSFRATVAEMHRGDQPMNTMYKTALAILVGAALSSAGVTGHAKELSTPRIATKTQVARVPPPPDKEGCYHYGSKGWKETECSSDADVKRLHHPALPYAINSDDRPTGFGGRHTPPLSLVSGVLDLSFDIVDSISDSLWGANAYGIQLNTNQFTGNNGHQIGVQFVYQSWPNHYEQICLWQNDLTAMDYSHAKCISVPRDRGPGLTAGDDPQIQAFVKPGQQISVVGHFPWAKGGHSAPWAIVAKDIYGFAGNWTQVSGSVMGEGDGSYLTFTDYAEVTVTLTASTCPGDMTASAKPNVLCPGQTLFQPTASAGYSAVTNEDSNLVAVIGYPPANYPSLVWLNSDLAQIAYIATSTGACPGGTSGPPNCTALPPPPPDSSCPPPACHAPPPNITIIGSPPH